MKDIPEGGSDLSGSGLGKPVPWEPTGRVDSACILEGLTCQGDSLDMMQCDRAMCRGGHFRARGKAVHVPFQKLKPTPLSMGPPGRPAEVFGGSPPPTPTRKDSGEVGKEGWKEEAATGPGRGSPGKLVPPILCFFNFHKNKISHWDTGILWHLPTKFKS